MNMGIHIIQGDCLNIMPRIPDSTIDAVITDPPYPEIDREYGRWTEDEWRALVDQVVGQCMRILKPTGSALFILQPNSERVGRMRAWIWKFVAYWARQWNLVQDLYWWNHGALPTVHCQRQRGLTRPSIKWLVWLGPPNCYRNQDAILWSPSDAIKAVSLEDRAVQHRPSGHAVSPGRTAAAAIERNGVTPFNLLPIGNTSQTSSGAKGHGAGTPEQLCRWLIRYLCPPDGLVLDPFGGAGTMAIAAIKEGRSCALIEKHPKYIQIARQWVAETTDLG